MYLSLVIIKGTSGLKVKHGSTTGARKKTVINEAISTIGVATKAMGDNIFLYIINNIVYSAMHL